MIAICFYFLKNNKIELSGLGHPDASCSQKKKNKKIKKDFHHFFLLEMISSRDVKQLAQN